MRLVENVHACLVLSGVGTTLRRGLRALGDPLALLEQHAANAAHAEDEEQKRNNGRNQDANA